MPLPQQQYILGICLLVNTDRKPRVLEIEPSGWCVHTTTGSFLNGNEAVAGATLEAFTRWLH